MGELWHDRQPYAFRTFVPWSRAWKSGVSSAEWPEALALELGDRVSESWFAEMMAQAWVGDLYLVEICTWWG